MKMLRAAAMAALAWVGLVCPSLAQSDVALSTLMTSLPAVSSLSGTELVLLKQGGVLKTATPTKFIFGAVTGDCTMASPPSIVCTKSNGTSFGALAFMADGSTLSNIPNSAINYGAVSTATTTLGASSGTFTSASSTLRYQQRGKLVWMSIKISITTNGTAAGNVQVSGLPFTFASTCALGGRAGLISGKMLQAQGTSGGNSLVIWNYDNTYPGANGEELDINGTCETT